MKDILYFSKRRSNKKGKVEMLDETLTKENIGPEDVQTDVTAEAAVEIPEENAKFYGELTKKVVEPEATEQEEVEPAVDEVVTEEETAEEPVIDYDVDNVSQMEYVTEVTLSFDEYIKEHHIDPNNIEDKCIADFCDNLIASMRYRTGTGYKNHKAFRRLINCFEVDGGTALESILTGNYVVTYKRLILDYRDRSIKLELHLNLGVIPTEETPVESEIVE